MGEIKVTVSANKPKSVSVKSQQVANEISASADTGRIWAQTSKNWAVSDSIVDNTDYSSKYYANKANESANNAKSFEQASREMYNSFLDTVGNAVNDVQDARDEAVESVTAIATTGVASVDEKINTGITNIEAKTTVGVELVEATKTNAVTEINNTKTTILKDIEFVAEGEKEEIQELADYIKDNAEDIANRTSFAMFDTIIKDHVLTYEESKGLALQGTYVYKEAIAGDRYGYPDFYAKVVEEYNEATVTETVNDVTVKVNANGHKFFDIADKASIDAFYSTMGTAWFYGVDTENERIFLPRDKYFAVNGIAPVVGNGMTIGLTNGSLNNGLTLSNQTKDLFPSPTNYGQPVGSTTTAQASTFGANNSVGLTTDPTKSGIEAHLEANEDKYLYICVGNTVSDTSWVDVVTQVQGGVKDLEDKKNASIAEIDANAKSYNNLTNRQITNCLLEVPQTIKLELKDGTLTLKAGSVVIVPNGFETDGTTPKFDYVTIESDKTYSTFGNNAQTVVYVTSILEMASLWVSNVYSGSTAPSGQQYMLWYDTANNLVKLTANSGSTWTSGFALPVGIATSTTTAFASIDQTFNGMGYIGSTIWVDKGVRGLAPNGRNKDGSLNNAEIITDKIIMRTSTSAGSNMGVVLKSDDVTWRAYFEQEEQPTVISRWFDINNNLMKQNSTSNLNSWSVIPYCYLGVANFTTNGQITSFEPKQPFRAVDYNDAVLKSSLTEVQVVTETYVNGTSWYRIWSDGWKEQGGYSSSMPVTVTLLKEFSNTNYTICATMNSNKNVGNYENLAVSNKTSTGFKLYQHTISNAVSWYACGY